MAVIEALGLLIVIIYLLYYYFTMNFDFWSKRGVKGPKPLPYVGNFMDMFLGKTSYAGCFSKAYEDFKGEPLVGLFDGTTPVLLIRNPDLIKDVLIKDFSKFPDRTFLPTEVEPLSQHLFRIHAEKWRPLRTKLSPVFTSGKLKDMFKLVLECSENYEKYLDELIVKEGIIECREISAKYTTDVIGSCAFGIEMNALSSGTSEFRTMGRQIFQTSWKTFLKDRLRVFPLLFRIFGKYLIDQNVQEFFKNITKEAIEYRIANNVHRPDFVDILVDLKLHPEKIELKELDDWYAAAQAFVFFAAGFETSSLTIAHAVFELALNHDIQERVREDIKNVLSTTDGKITYDCIKEMKYLHAFFQETLRKYPVLMYLDRLSVVDYTFSGTKVTIPKGTQIFLPVHGIQRDPEIYPDPEVFDPDRFTDENAKTRHPMTFLPFGDGPRNCIGARFATNQTKVGIIKILSKFKVDVCEKTQIPYIKDPKTLFFFQPTHGIYVKMTKLET